MPRADRSVLRFVTAIGAEADELDREFSSFQDAVEHAQSAVDSRQAAEVEVYQIWSTTDHFVARVNVRGIEMVGEVIEPPSATEVAALRSRRHVQQLGDVTLRRRLRSTTIATSVPPPRIRDRLGARRRSTDDNHGRVRVREVELESLGGFTVGFGVTAAITLMMEGDGKHAATAIHASFRPSRATAGWTLFTSCLAAVSVVALVETIVVGSGPLLWPFGGIGLFGGFAAWMVVIAVRCRRRIEADLLAAATPKH